MKNSVESKNIILLAIAIGFFYFGDIITTFLILDDGGHELNRYIAAIGFDGFVVLKTVFVILVTILIYYLDKLKFSRESGIIIGMVLMSGLLATLYNVGFYTLNT